MRRNGYVSAVWLVLLAAALAGCGSSSNSSKPKPTGLKKRVLLSNQQNNNISLMDASKDVVAKNLGATTPGKMVAAGGFTVILQTALDNVTIIDNTAETATVSASFGDQPVDIALSTDGKTEWVAERSAGAVQFGTTADGAVSPSIIPVANARRLVMSPNGTKLLVFSDPLAQTHANSHTFFVIDTATKGLAVITSPTKLDQPFTAVFGGSDTQAFILNCGAECGGVAASVVSVDFSGVFASPAVPATFGTSVPVTAATAGLLSGANLFVAGTPSPALTGPGPACPLSRCGTLQVVNTSNLTASAAVPITDGLHEKMALTSNGRLYAGASGCTVDPGTAANTVRGCLTIFNTSSLVATFPTESAFRQNFDVTGFQPISKRNVIYVVQGGELDIFDITTDALATGITQIDIIGKAIDAVQIDP
jgi:hypothetical protein